MAECLGYYTVRSIFQMPVFLGFCHLIWHQSGFLAFKINMALQSSLGIQPYSKNPVPGSLPWKYDLMGTLFISVSKSTTSCLGNKADGGILLAHSTVLCFPIAWCNKAVGCSVQLPDRHQDSTVVRQKFLRISLHQSFIFQWVSLTMKLLQG